jgi:hypothetical protein
VLPPETEGREAMVSSGTPLTEPGVGAEAGVEFPEELPVLSQVPVVPAGSMAEAEVEAEAPDRALKDLAVWAGKASSSSPTRR